MEIFASGCCIERSVLSATECDYLLAVLSAAPNHGGRAGTRDIMSIQAVRDLAKDGRLLQLAQGALSGPAVPFRATMFAKSGDANWLIPWHQDTALPLAVRSTTRNGLRGRKKSEFFTRTHRRGRFLGWLRCESTWMPRPARMVHCEWCLDRIKPVCLPISAESCSSGRNSRDACPPHRVCGFDGLGAGHPIGSGLKPRAWAPIPNPQSRFGALCAPNPQCVLPASLKLSAK